MKKILSFLIIAVFVLAAMTSCQEEKTLKHDDVMGTWYFESDDIDAARELVLYGYEAKEIGYLEDFVLFCRFGEFYVSDNNILFHCTAESWGSDNINDASTLEEKQVLIFSYHKENGVEYLEDENGNIFKRKY